VFYDHAKIQLWAVQQKLWGGLMPKTEVLCIRYDNVTLKEAADEIIGMVSERKSHYVVTPNPEISEACLRNKRLQEAIENANYAVPDGIGVVYAARICGTPLKERVGGYDLACELLPRLSRDKLSLYLLGAKPGVAEKAAEKITSLYPGVNICGTHNGYFDGDDEVIGMVNEASPDMVFVALGSPRQEIWMYENRAKVDTGVMLGLGGGLDVFAGVVKRAPKVFIRLNLEWFYRLIRQPYRFGRMLKLPKYLLRAVMTRLFKKSKPEK
jgi:N-acetylglucosaminyldiphosphoundecaprenol N-acetyl-beta-D-mannosaminyltransferase